MTFTAVLEKFAYYLNEDTVCEVLSTRHGYVVMLWDDVTKDWCDVICCQTAEDLYDA